MSLLVLPTYKEIISRNSLLTESLRQCAVYPWFATPIKAAWRHEFVIIRLTQQMLGEGEEKFWLPEIHQGFRPDSQQCKTCYGWLERVQVHEYRCPNPQCQRFDRGVLLGPVRGVVDVAMQSDFIVQTDRETILTPVGERELLTHWIDRCVVILDRRYPEITLSQVMRTVGMMCDINGWKLK